jgi:hypothetical protein
MSEASINRTIYRSARKSCQEVELLLEAIFVGELIFPSKEFWIVSPWISDIRLLDNRAATFASLGPDWNRSHIRLCEVLSRLLEGGMRVCIATRPAEHNIIFKARLDQLVQELQCEDQLRYVEREDLHTKGILTEKLWVLGSMNLTESGVRINDETVRVTTNSEEIELARVAIREEYADDYRSS